MFGFGRYRAQGILPPDSGKANDNIQYDLPKL